MPPKNDTDKMRNNIYLVIGFITLATTIASFANLPGEVSRIKLEVKEMQDKATSNRELLVRIEERVKRIEEMLKDISRKNSAELRAMPYLFDGSGVALTTNNIK